MARRTARKAGHLPGLADAADPGAGDLPIAVLAIDNARRHAPERFPMIRKGKDPKTEPAREPPEGNHA
jgi:hypothetical protein